MTLALRTPPGGVETLWAPVPPDCVARLATLSAPGGDPLGRQDRRRERHQRDPSGQSASWAHGAHGATLVDSWQPSRRTGTTRPPFSSFPQNRPPSTGRLGQRLAHGGEHRPRVGAQVQRVVGRDGEDGDPGPATMYPTSSPGACASPTRPRPGSRWPVYGAGTTPSCRRKPSVSQTSQVSAILPSWMRSVDRVDPDGPVGGRDAVDVAHVGARPGPAHGHLVTRGEHVLDRPVAVDTDLVHGHRPATPSGPGGMPGICGSWNSWSSVKSSPARSLRRPLHISSKNRRPRLFGCSHSPPPELWRDRNQTVAPLRSLTRVAALGRLPRARAPPRATRW